MDDESADERGGGEQGESAGTAMRAGHPRILAHTEAVRRLILAMLGIAIAIDIAYWTIWFLDRDVLASEHTQAYYDFENAFPLADAWLGLCVLLALRAAHRSSPTVLLWLLAGGGAGVYLFSMDVLYDVEHGIYATGAGGLVELAINLLTLGLSVWFLRWAWSRREVLLSSPG